MLMIVRMFEFIWLAAPVTLTPDASIQRYSIVWIVDCLDMLKAS